LPMGAVSGIRGGYPFAFGQPHPKGVGHFVWCCIQCEPSLPPLASSAEMLFMVEPFLEAWSALYVLFPRGAEDEAPRVRALSPGAKAAARFFAERVRAWLEKEFTDPAVRREFVRTMWSRYFPEGGIFEGLRKNLE
jgi:hypothetical protein